jgi:plastocyanin
MRSKTIRTVATLAAFLSACSEPPMAPGLDDGADPGDIQGLIVSSGRGLLTATPQAFVSLQPGSVTQGSRVLVHNTTRGGSVETSLSNGGFDPVAIRALSGDVIGVEIAHGGTSVITASRIPVPLPPLVIRTDPPKRRTSVPLNAMMVVVFSEPIDPSTVTAGTITLRSQFGEVALDFTLLEDGTVVAAQPRASLRPLTDYTLEIGTGIQDLSGDALASVETVSTCLLPDSIPFFVRLLPDTLTLPVETYSGFIVAVDSGARIINEFPDTSLTWAATDSSIVSVDWAGNVGGLAIGQAYVTVEYQGEIDSALVIVTESPPPGPFGVWPDAATIPIGFEQQFDIRHPAGTERPDVTWSTTDASIIVVDDTGVVTAVAAGTAYVVATDGTLIDSAQVDVYDPLPPLGERYVIYPDSFLLQVGDAREIRLSGPDWPPPPVTWSYSNPGVVEVADDATLTALAPGETDIIATFSDGSSTSGFAEVVEAGTLGYISLVPSEVTAAVGDTVRFTIEYDATAAALWGNENPAWGTTSYGVQVLQFITSGAFEAIAAGTSRVRAYVGPLIADAVVTVTQ